MCYVSVPNKVNKLYLRLALGQSQVLFLGLYTMYGALHKLVKAHEGINVLKRELQSLAVMFNALEVDC